MRKGVILSLLLHALGLAPLLFVYAPRLSAPSARETAPQTRFLAQTVNIESLRPPSPVRVNAAAPPAVAPKPVVSKAEQAVVAVAPAQSNTVEPSRPEPPPEPEVAPEPESAPPPPEPKITKAEPQAASRVEPPPEPERPPQHEPPAEQPPSKTLAEKEPPAAKQAPAQDQRLAMMNDAPVSKAPSSAPQAAQAPTAGESAESDADYLTRIRALIEQQKRYPPMALRLGMEGEVRLWFVLNRQGRVLDYRIDQGSGHAMLDEEVERLIQKIAAFPPVPPDMGADRLELVVPISFRLAG